MNLFSNISDHATIIAPTYLHTPIRMKLLEDAQGKLGITLLSLSSFFRQDDLEDDELKDTILFKYRNILKDHTNDYPIFKHALLSITFLSDCFSLIEDMKSFHIDINDLPENNDSNTELKNIISLLYDIPTPADTYHKQMERLSSQTFPDVYIYDTYFSILDKQKIEFLLDHGAHIFNVPHINRKKDLYYAINKKQEIEAIAQMIINKKYHAEDICITTCDSSYVPIIKQVFDHYQIPFYSNVTQRVSSSTYTNFCALLKYYLQPTMDHLLTCLDYHLFVSENLYSLIEFVNTFQIQDIRTPFHHLDKVILEGEDANIGNVLNAFDVQKLIKLQEKAEIARENICEQVHAYLYEPNLEKVLVHSLKIVSNSCNTMIEQSNYYALHRMLSLCKDQVQTIEDLQFLLSLLDNRVMVIKETCMQGVCVNSLNQGTLPHPYHFLVGANQSNYPAFNSKSGIFDEAYYAMIPYPDMQKRYSYHMQQIQKGLGIHTHLYASYALGNYEGKSMEVALDIEKLFDHAIAYPIYDSYLESDPLEKQIDPVLAKQLYLKDDVLTGSISAFERYAKCPFSYFLRYGLKLEEPMSHTFSLNYMGTLSHYVLEMLKNHNFAEFDPISIKNIIDDEIDCIKIVFPNMEKELDTRTKRIYDMLSQSIKRIHDHDMQSGFKTLKCEEKFNAIITIDDHLKFNLTGIIDRIDTTSNLAIIYDYKSSPKSISRKELDAGIQLQLPTYAWILNDPNYELEDVHDQTKKKHYQLVGVYYISLKNENIDANAMKVDRRKKIIKDLADEDYLLDKQKAHRYDGWAFDPLQLDADPSGIFYKTSKITAKDGLKLSKSQDFDKLDEDLYKIYKILCEKITEGEIECEPIEKACMFCKYHDICRFHGKMREIKPLIEKEDD